MKRGNPEAVADYFGLVVGVLHRLEQCSLIRFEEREFIVDTCDLVFAEVQEGCSLKQAA